MSVAIATMGMFNPPVGTGTTKTEYIETYSHGGGIEEDFMFPKIKFNSMEVDYGKRYPTVIILSRSD